MPNTELWNSFDDPENAQTITVYHIQFIVYFVIYNNYYISSIKKSALKEECAREDKANPSQHVQ